MGENGMVMVCCPTPRRLSRQPFSQVRPWWCSSSFNRRPHGGPEGEVVCEIMEILLNRSVAIYGESGYGTPLSQCTSPPIRASNPLVNDVQFRDQQQRLSNTETNPMISPTPTFQPAPIVRIEGFKFSGKDSTCTFPAMALFC